MINIAQNQMPRQAVADIRCAVYTRKSTDENLDSDFNSLDAQRESAENYIKSQAHEGWSIIPTRYDDGAYSGATMDRPAVQKLLRDVDAGQVDVVIVYKLDRLSRNLLEFNQTLKFFEQHDVSFVSVTEQFNTNTPMGRFGMNMISSFSQMEREVIAERIRDKVAASKRRGKWMGGVPPLGYDVNRKEKKLIVNAKEAILVRLIFRRYLELKSATALLKELNDQGHRTKTWVTKKDIRREGIGFDKNKVYKILKNVTYQGLTKHKDKAYPGEHEAIIEQSLFDEVQKLLSENTVNRGNVTRSKTTAMLRGVLICGYCGRTMVPTYSLKKGRKYRYYVCQTATKRSYNECKLKSVSADKLEAPIKDAIRKLISNPDTIKQTLEKAGYQMADEIQRLVTSEKQLAEELATVKANAKRLLAEELQSTRVIDSFIREELSRLESQTLNLEYELEQVRNRLAYYNDHPLDETAILAAFADLDALFDELFPAEQERLVQMIVEKIRVFRDHMEASFKPDALLDIANELGSWQLKTKCRDDKTSRNAAENATGNTAETSVIIQLNLETYRPQKQILLAGNKPWQPVHVPNDDQTAACTALNVSLAHRWMKLLETGQVKSVVDLADLLDRDISKLRKIMKLADLDPLEVGKVMGNQ